MRTIRCSGRPGGGDCPGGVCLGGLFPRGVSTQGGVCLERVGGVCLEVGGVYPPDPEADSRPLLWTETITDRCKNITFPQLLFEK